MNRNSVQIYLDESMYETFYRVGCKAVGCTRTNSTDRQIELYNYLIENPTIFEKEIVCDSIAVEDIVHKAASTRGCIANTITEDRRRYEYVDMLHNYGATKAGCCIWTRTRITGESPSAFTPTRYL